MNKKILEKVYEFSYNNPNFLIFLKEEGYNDILKLNLTNWKEISKLELSENFINIFQDFISWKCVITQLNLTEDFLIKYENKINWLDVLKYQNLSRKILDKFKLENEEWIFITKEKNLNYYLLKYNESCWKYISKYQYLTKDMLNDYKDFLFWDDICKYQKLHENIIEEFSYKMSWKNICRYQKLSEKFINNNWYDINWKYVSIYQKLSENFIIQNDNRINWKYVFRFQKLSYDFLKEYIHKCISQTITPVNEIYF